MRDTTTGEAKGASLGLAFLLGLLGWLIPLVGYRVALATTCGDGATYSATDVLAYLLIAAVVGGALGFGLGFAGIWAALHLTGAEPGTLADGRRATSDRRIETGGTR